MGNGESTSRRIAMQRSDEGTIQVSEGVMLRLKGEEADMKPGIQLEEGEAVIHEEELKLMIENAFLQGRKQEFDKFENEKRTIEKTTEKLVKEEHEKFEELKRNLESKLEELPKEIPLGESEAIVHEEELKMMIENAFLQGRKHEFDKYRNEKQSLKQTTEELLKQEEEKFGGLIRDLELKLQEQAKESNEKDKYKTELQQISEMSFQQRQKCEENVNQINELLKDEKEKFSNEIEALNHALLDERLKVEEKDREVSESLAKVIQEKEELQQKAALSEEEIQKVGEALAVVSQEKQDLEKKVSLGIEELSKVHENINMILQEKDELKMKVTLREEEIVKEFHKSVQDIEHRIKPLESSAICTESQSNVLECYRQHKNQPLKCAKEVKQFIDCVQETRLKFMQKHLIDGKSS